MKRLKLIFTTLLVCSLTFSTFAQMQSVSWKTVPEPASFSEAIFSQRAQIDQLSNGKWYFSYIDDNSNVLYVKRFDTKNQIWELVYNFQVNTWSPVDLDTYVANDKLYVGLVTDEIASNNFSLWEINTNEDVTQLLDNEPSSISPGSSMEFVVAGDELFLATVNSGEYSIDSYSLTNPGYITTAVVSGLVNTSVPDIVVDHSDNSLVVSAIDASDFYVIYKASIQATLNFQPMNGDGYVNSSIAGANTSGNKINLIEKEGNSPEAIFVFDDGISTNLYRVGLYTNTVAEMKFTNPDLLSAFYTAQFGTSTYVGGFNGIAGGSEVWEVFPNGNKLAVAADNTPAFLNNTADGLITDYSSHGGTGRAAVFYHIGTGNGTGPGNFQFTNNPPSINTLDIGNGCNGNATMAIKNLKFTDIDGDYVHIINSSFTSSNQSVVNSGSIFASENFQNEWGIQVIGDAAGQTEISFNYTDGFDTLNASYTIQVLEPEPVSYTTANVELCINQNSVDMSQYVDSIGGTFYIGSFVTEDGLVPFDSLDIQSLPHIDNAVLYEYIDVNGCVGSATGTVTIYDNPSSTLNVTNSTCGSNDGEIIASINSPNGNYVNYWNNGAQGVNTITGLAPGTYYHNILDQVGCMSVNQANVQSADVNLSGTVTEPTCFGANNGSIELTINGANGPYNVLWSSGHSTPIIQNLTAGNYVAVVTNGNGCVVSESFDLNQPAPIEMAYSKIAPDCGQNNGAVVQNNIQGGNGGYSYLWTSGGTGVNMSGVPAGNYGLQVTDAEGCTATKAYQLNPVEGAGVSANVSKAICGTNTGSIELDVFPAIGESVTNIDWSNGATTEDIYNLAPGTYTCQIEQTNGCTADYTWVVQPVRPPRPEICVVTVDTSTTTNLVVWEKPTANVFSIDHYNIYRETNVAGQFQLIDTVNYSSISVFNDVVASPLTRSWRYRISAVTTCGMESLLSTPHKTIHLVIEDLGNGDFEIVWDNYEGFPYSTYDLLRYTDQQGEWLPVAQGIPFNALPNETDTPQSIAGLDYMIEITPPGGLCSATEGKAQDYNSSRSNKPRSSFNPGDGTGDPNNSLIKHESDDYTIAMYPNPSEGQFEVALYHEKSNIDMKIEVVNLQGQIVYNSSIQNGVNYIDLGSVESGVYFVNVEDGNTSERMKIVIK